jgi:hypothetical protein
VPIDVLAERLETSRGALYKGPRGRRVATSHVLLHVHGGPPAFVGDFTGHRAVDV